MNALALLYKKIVKINDTPQKIALGLGLGVFTGILPGTGPLASLFLALVFRANRASALLGSLLTNTWLSLATFFLSVKIGSALMGLSWHTVKDAWIEFLDNFNWANLFKSSVLRTALPVILGYFVVAFCLGVLVYLTALLLLTRNDNIKRRGERQAI